MRKDPRAASFALPLLAGFLAGLLSAALLFIAEIPIVADPSVVGDSPKITLLRKWIWERDIRILIEECQRLNREQKARAEEHWRVCSDP